MPEVVVLEDKNALKEGNAMVVQALGKQYALYNVKGQFFATLNACPHMGGPLGKGVLENEIIICPLHGQQYNVKTGASVANPKIRVETKRAKVSGNKVIIEV